ncbi:PREDICTED: protein cereblon homolog [Ceratosolen solmsi marchali]|uniref:Protein cereblon homolog n=1 Tax=Ceratosolen solmsi marchali TaxID=326594 RepID=A0AAJ6YX87_9HYME|nr:PREDICTED: protein cereblon homolog [Ceratosolen solmsi marchali]
MWQTVVCCLLNYSPMGSKHLFDTTTSYILCRRCGADLADTKHIINHLSPEANIAINQTIFEQKDVAVQVFSNSLGIKFYSISFSNTKCTAINNWQQNFTWYPGYAWKPCICKQCGVHHGWVFEPIESIDFNPNQPSKKGFFVLKLAFLLNKKFADSLIVVPKSYMN